MIDENKREELKNGLTAYVQQITERDPRAGRSMYKCPFCHSGHGGRNSTGAFSITPDGKNYKCFSCGKSGDIFTLIGELEGLDSFTDQVRRAAEVAGVSLDTPAVKTEAPAEKEEQQPIKGHYRDYIERCKAAAGKTDYFERRGFTPEVVEHFNLGYDEDNKSIVIPYDRDGSYYITRKTEEKKFRKPPRDEAGTEPIYNKGALYDSKPCFVCESPIDAISIITSGAGSCGAVALGGTGDEKLIKQLEKQKPSSMLVLSFDEDEKGREATERTADGLRSLGVPFIIANYSTDVYPEDQRKDANDFLRGNPEQLKQDITANIEAVERITNAERTARLEAHNVANGAERLKDFIDGIKERANTSYVPSGFSELDKELDGGLYDGLYVLGAVSSLGKTTFLLQVADQIAAAGYDVLYFSLEMAASELISKSISRLTFQNCGGDERNAKTARGITTLSRYVNYSQREKDLIKQAINEYGRFAEHLYIYEGVGSIGVDEIKRLVAEHRELTGKTPLVMLDYLQILAPYDMRASDKQNTDKAVLELKRLSRDFRTPVVAISSFNRDNYMSEVNMSAFKESGAIEYGSDVLLAMQPEGMESGYTSAVQNKNAERVKECKASAVRSVEVVVLKNRNGRTGGKVGFNYYSLFNCFKQDYSVQNEDD